MTALTIMILACVALTAALLAQSGRRVLSIVVLLILGALLGNVTPIVSQIAVWVLDLPALIAGLFPAGE